MSLNLGVVVLVGTLCCDGCRNNLRLESKIVGPEAALKLSFANASAQIAHTLTHVFSPVSKA